MSKRYMCEVVFIDGEEEAEAVGDKLHAAGFELMVSDHPDDFDECQGVTKFGMIWKDFDDDVDPARARSEFEDAVIAVSPHGVDSFGFVAPDHIPTRLGDFGERSAVIDELNCPN